MNKAAQALGKLGGKAKSAAKARACRRNGKKGGRPRKITAEDQAAIDGHVRNLEILAAAVRRLDRLKPVNGRIE